MLISARCGRSKYKIFSARCGDSYCFLTDPAAHKGLEPVDPPAAMLVLSSFAKEDHMLFVKRATKAVKLGALRHTVLQNSFHSTVFIIPLDSPGFPIPLYRMPPK